MQLRVTPKVMSCSVIVNVRNASCQMQIPMHSFRSSLQIDFPPLNMPYQECKRKRFIGFQSSLNENCEVKVVPLHILKVYEYVES